jgi:hypothetical protein
MLLLASACAANTALPTETPQADHAPQSVSRFLLALDTAEAGLPYRIRERLLQSVYSRNSGSRPDRYAYMKLHVDGMHYSARVATFPGTSPKHTVYLFSSSGDVPDCAAVLGWMGPRDRVGPDFCRHNEDVGIYQLHSVRTQRFGFSAYRIGLDGRARNVTDSVFPEDPVLNLPAGERYSTHDELGRSRGATADLSRLPEVPVIRLYLELRDGGGLPRSHPRALSGGYSGDRVHTAHFGFLVWDGKRFELRDKVQRALWPCQTDRRIPSSADSCYPGDPDPFILASEPNP